MDDPGSFRAYGLQAVAGCLVAQVTGRADEDGLNRLKREILDDLAGKKYHGVLINVSAVSVLGSYGFAILRETAKAVEMMGATAVFVGFRPGVAAALVEFNIDLSGIRTAVSTADALELVNRTDPEDQADLSADGHGETMETPEEPDGGSLL